MPALYLGIDPGKQGGIAAIHEDGMVYSVAPMLTTEADLFVYLSGYSDANNEHDGVVCRAYLERVHAMPKQGVTSAFTFGQGYGSLIMALTAAGIPFELVSPQVWQKALGCLSKGDKNVTKRKAQQLFPSVQIKHSIADALLIAEYGRRLHRG